MRVFKKILKYTGLTILILLIGISSYVYFSVPKLPEDTDKIIDEVMNNPLPELITGKTGYAKSSDINIWYESILPKDSVKGTILFIMGIATDGLGWPNKFLKLFVDSGYQVIRFDHRGTGMSDWLENRDSKNPYSLADMANDCVAILNTLEIEKAHIVGVSMGGMIAQELTYYHPDKVQTLTLISTSGNEDDPDLPPISKSTAIKLVTAGIKYGLFSSERNMIKLAVAGGLILRGDANYEINIKNKAEIVLYNLRNRKGYNFKVSFQHLAAVNLSGSRYDKLMMIKAPTFVIHSSLDRFIPIEHGQKCARIIPNADSLWLDNMGHNISDNLFETISSAIMKHFYKY